MAHPANDTYPETPLLTVAQIARRYRVGREQIHRWIRSGDLAPAIRVGRVVRVSSAALDEFERRHSAAGGRR